MEGYLTRRQAAEKLGMSRQTVSNWIDSGFIDSKNINGVIYVSENVIEQLATPLQDIACMEKKIEKKKRKLQEEEERLESERKAIRKDIFQMGDLKSVGLTQNFIISVIMAAELNRLITAREANILVEILTGSSVPEVASNYGLTTARIYQMTGKAIKKMSKLEGYVSLLKEVNSLRKDLVTLKDVVDKQNKEILKLTIEGHNLSSETGCNNMELTIKLLNTPLLEHTSELSVRARNALVCAPSIKSKTNPTFGDLVAMKGSDLMHIKNFGKKSLDEIREWLDRYGLKLGMNVEKYLEIGVDMNKITGWDNQGKKLLTAG